MASQFILREGGGWVGAEDLLLHREAVAHKTLKEQRQFENSSLRRQLPRGVTGDPPLPPNHTPSRRINLRTQPPTLAKDKLWGAMNIYSYRSASTGFSSAALAAG